MKAKKIKLDQVEVTSFVTCIKGNEKATVMGGQTFGCTGGPICTHIEKALTIDLPEITDNHGGCNQTQPHICHE